MRLLTRRIQNIIATSQIRPCFYLVSLSNFTQLLYDGAHRPMVSIDDPRYILILINDVKSIVFYNRLNGKATHSGACQGIHRGEYRFDRRTRSIAFISTRTGRRLEYRFASRTAIRESRADGGCDREVVLAGFGRSTEEGPAHLPLSAVIH